MWTIKYKGMFVHGYFDSSKCHWGFPGFISREFKSLHAVKMAITKYLKNNP